VARNDVAARVDERVGRRGVVSLILPPAGEDDPHGRLRVGLAAAEKKRIHVEEHAAEGHAGHKAKLVRGRAEASGNAVYIVTLVDQSVLAADVRRAGIAREQRSLAEQDMRIFLRHRQQERIVVERRREDQAGAICDQALNCRRVGSGFGSLLSTPVVGALREVTRLDHLHVGDSS
jgi:hypothetical protein